MKLKWLSNVNLLRLSASVGLFTDDVSRYKLFPPNCWRLKKNQINWRFYALHVDVTREWRLEYIFICPKCSRHLNWFEERKQQRSFSFASWIVSLSPVNVCRGKCDFHCLIILHRVDWTALLNSIIKRNDNSPTRSPSLPSKNNDFHLKWRETSRKISCSACYITSGVA